MNKGSEKSGPFFVGSLRRLKKGNLMKLLKAIAIGASFATIAACSTIEQLPEQRLASANLYSSAGLPIGTAQVLTRSNAVYLTVAATGLEPGEHGFHLHTTGTCTAPDFKSAGGHLNPLGKQHGSLNPDGKHVGDLANLAVGASRSASRTYELTGSPAQIAEWLFDADGTAVVIHAGPDDYRTDPAGDAGSRVACGVLKAS
ncbi:superoxide dismutase family protein [Qipengyuania oceanensis]|nr:superoxide dismutase family protein [Qipengyuania oceanensis]